MGVEEYNICGTWPISENKQKQRAGLQKRRRRRRKMIHCMQLHLGLASPPAMAEPDSHKIIFILQLSI